jgi:hypothetical protein
VSYKDDLIRCLFREEKDKLGKIAEEIFLHQFNNFSKIAEDCEK